MELTPHQRSEFLEYNHCRHHNLCYQLPEIFISLSKDRGPYELRAIYLWDYEELHGRVHNSECMGNSRGCSLSWFVCFSPLAILLFILLKSSACAIGSPTPIQRFHPPLSIVSNPIWPMLYPSIDLLLCFPPPTHAHASSPSNPRGIQCQI